MTTQPTTTTSEVTMSTTNTHQYECYCGCGGTVQVTFDGGFAGTTCTITPCPKAPAFVLAFQVRRTAVLEMNPKAVAA